MRNRVVHTGNVLVVIGHRGPTRRVVRADRFFGIPRRIFFSFVWHWLVEERQPEGAIVAVRLKGCVSELGKLRLRKSLRLVIKLAFKSALSRRPSVAPCEPVGMLGPNILYAHFIAHQRRLFMLENRFPVEILPND